jgi:hypothetical protein
MEPGDGNNESHATCKMRQGTIHNCDGDLETIYFVSYCLFYSQLLYLNSSLLFLSWCDCVRLQNNRISFL